MQTLSDNGGVHTNSGIPNKAFADLSWRWAGPPGRRPGASGTRRCATPPGPDATLHRLRPHHTLVTAQRLYGAGSDEVNAVQGAWQGVGIVLS